MTIKDIIERVKENIKIVIGLIVVVLIALFLFLKNVKTDEKDTLATTTLLTKSTTEAKTSSKSEPVSSEKSDQFVVDIKGAVQKPAIYTLSKGARVNDVVNLAGGFTEQADTKSVNLAQKLTDEMVIYVASLGESVASSSTAKPESNGAGNPGDKVNINTADVTQLQTLSGVGAKRAQDIIDYRESHGNFKTIEELANVSGIGEKTIEKLKESITVD
jgi:competence protein ComEA